MTDRVTFLESEGVRFLPTSDGRLRWIWGQRSSVDQHGETFETASAAAAHFLSMPEGYSFIVGHGAREYYRGKQHAIDDYKRLQEHAREQAREITKIRGVVAQFKLAEAQRNAKKPRLRRLLGGLRKLAPSVYR